MNTCKMKKVDLELNSNSTMLNFGNGNVLELDDKSSIYSKLSVHLLECPICFRYFDNEEKCFEHFLDYFDHSQHFLFHRYNLVFWLNSYLRIASGELITGKISLSKDENMNTVTNKNLKTESCIESEETSDHRCEICIHSSIHVRVEIPAIDLHLNCPLCEKYFSRGESCFIHIFTHMKMFAAKETRKRIFFFTQDVFQPLKNWIAVFFRSYSSDKILTKYNQYKQILNTPLLSKILWSEIKELKHCKLCEKPVISMFDLLNNHRNCKPNEATQSFCVLCNFKAADMDLLISHFFLDHVFCYCGYHGEDFDSFINHSKGCTAQKNGIVCPFCRVNKFMTTGAFRNHIEETKKKTCGSILKKNQWVCLICKIQSSQQEIFNHILMEHISCLCGYKNKDMKIFFKHTDKCAVKKTTLFCSICRKVKYSSKAELKQHVSHCLPWNRDQKLKPIEIQNEEVKSQLLKRKGN